MIVINSPLSVEECLRRLRRKMDPPWAVFGQRRLVGGVLGTRFFATIRPEMLKGVSTGPVLTARVEPDKDGAVIRCAFRPPLFMIFLAMLTVLIVCLYGATWLKHVGALISGDQSQRNWSEVLRPLTYLALVRTLAFLVRQQYSNDPDVLISRIRRAVDPEAGVILYE